LGTKAYIEEGDSTLSGQDEHEEGLIRPMKRRWDPEVGPDVLMVMIPVDVEYLLKRAPLGNLACLDQGFFKIHQVRREGGNPLTLCGPFLGAPQAVMGMEKLIALGARRVWVLGWCGSIQPDLKVGDFIVPTDAVSEEGTSRHYPIGPKKAATDQELNRLLGEALAKEEKTFRRGTVWTTDAPYRETPSKVAQHRQQGVLAVEMEMSALMTLSVYRSVRLAALLVVSDELSELKWRAGFSDPRFKERSRFAGDFLLRLVERGVDPEDGIG
jgi:uridine phosphorylase